MTGKAAILGRGATYQDLREVPDHLIAEILDGDLWVSPHPAPRHQHVAMMLSIELGPPFQHGEGGPGGWNLLFEPELHLGHDVLVPDLAGWRKERTLKLMERAHITDSPDWVCEIISKSTEKIDRGLKQRIYARHGVRYLWFADPIKRTLEVFKLAADVWVPILTADNEAIANAQPFDAVPFRLSRIWPER
jgi:hypothetical protein